MPGEVSLAHNGVLFLDELPEYSKVLTDSLRQPIEDGRVTITRVNGRVTYPCTFMLVCAMNPCKCGYFGHPTEKCTCGKGEVYRYVSKVSGPMLDRIDIEVELPSLTAEELTSDKVGESSADVRARVIAAREFAKKRYIRNGYTDVYSNAQLTPRQMGDIGLTDEAKNALRTALETTNMSARAYDRIVRVARTIADLEKSESIEVLHVAEAIQYRSLDRKYWRR